MISLANLIPADLLQDGQIFTRSLRNVDVTVKVGELVKVSDAFACEVISQSEDWLTEFRVVSLTA
jgi:hypothetical protein